MPHEQERAIRQAIRAVLDAIPLPTITVEPGYRHVAADEGLAALHAADVGFYQRDRLMVRVAPVKAKASDGTKILVPGIVPVSAAICTRALASAAHWRKFNSKGKPVEIDPPGPVVEQILSMLGEWPFEVLTGVVTCPTLRPDGSLLEREGYDDMTGLVLANNLRLPPISARPTKDDAKAAAASIEELLNGFPFADDASKAVALSIILTPILRGAFPLAPLHLTTAPEAGSGKSYLDDIVAAIATGERCPVIALAPSAEETEKRLIGAALAGHPIITLDNVRAALEGDFLCQVTERPLLQLRPLGTSETIRVANTFTVFANGNNLAVADDIVRRSIRCRIDAETETPEQRTFATNPRALALGNRGLYIADALTLARAYIVAGRPERLRPLPSYEGWSDLVRSALVWLGYDDPVATMEDIRGTDPVRLARADIFAAWRDELPIAEQYQTGEIAEHAEARYDYNQSLIRPKLRAALLAVAAKRGRGDEIDVTRLGLWLRRNENTIVDKFKLTVDRIDRARPRWQLGPVSKGGG
jgi:putative DNA primase/helicase